MTSTKPEASKAESLTRVRSLCASGAAKSIRLGAGLSLQETGDEIEVDKSTVFRWEEGQRTPRGEKAVRYGQLLERLMRRT